MDATTRVFVARFQAPYLQEGHIGLIHEVIWQHNRVVIVLGTTPIMGSQRNPYDFHYTGEDVEVCFSRPYRTATTGPSQR